MQSPDRPSPAEQARVLVAEHGARALRRANENARSARARSQPRSTVAYWQAVATEIQQLQRAGAAEVALHGSAPKGTAARTARLDLRVEPADKEMIELAARTAGISTTDWVIRACREYVQRGGIDREFMD